MKVTICMNSGEYEVMDFEDGYAIKPIKLFEIL